MNQSPYALYDLATPDANKTSELVQAITLALAASPVWSKLSREKQTLLQFVANELGWCVAFDCYPEHSSRWVRLHEYMSNCMANSDCGRILPTR